MQEDQLKTYEGLIKQILEKFPYTRDDDTYVVFHLYQALGFHPSTLTVETMLKLQKQGELPTEESIKRLRRKVQLEFKSLRGNKWEERHKKEEAVQLDLAYGK